ncbi:hypothetical protein CTI14_54085, partial [Methylobacterium radiotolerans]
RAAERTVYTGTLQGVGDIVMELDSATAGNELTGRYFYPEHGVDIPLKGSEAALQEPMTFAAATAPGAQPAATWQGKRDAQAMPRRRAHRLHRHASRRGRHRDGTGQRHGRQRIDG